jgi:hypothetical protein
MFKIVGGCVDRLYNRCTSGYQGVDRVSEKILLYMREGN